MSFLSIENASDLDWEHRKYCATETPYEQEGHTGCSVLSLYTPFVLIQVYILYTCNSLLDHG